MGEIEKAEFIEISSGIYVLENKIRCELNIEDYLLCDKFRENTRGCINCDCVIIEDEDKYSLEIMADELQNHKAVVEKMQDKIEELEKVNKSLECCGNCKYYKLDRGITCLRPQKTLCIKWYPSEPGAVNLWIAKGIK